MKAIRIFENGTPDVMQWVDLELPAPAANEVRIAHTHVGVNFIDTYHRAGIYPIPLPSGLGVEAAGIVEAVGADISHVKAGDRVVYFAPVRVGYATHANVEGRWVAKLPESVGSDVAAALWLKAGTTEFLVERCARVKAGDAVLVQAGAGGVGLLLCAWLKSVGATVIATVGSAEKAPVAKAAGADHVIDYTDTAAKVREITDGKGVAAAIDGVGRDTMKASIDSLAKRGMFISYGNASGMVTGFEFSMLQQGGSLIATRPSVFDYYATLEDQAIGTAAVLRKIEEGVLKVHIGQRFALENAADAHRALEARQTVGSTLLIV